jgi:hypothetical protein
MLVTGCVQLNDAYKGLVAGHLFYWQGMIPLGIAMKIQVQMFFVQINYFQY